MKNVGVWIIVFIALASLAGSAQIADAFISFLLVGLIPGTTHTIHPNIILGLTAGIILAMLLPRLIQYILFPPVVFSEHSLPKKRYVKL